MLNSKVIFGKFTVGRVRATQQFFFCYRLFLPGQIEIDINIHELPLTSDDHTEKDEFLNSGAIPAAVGWWGGGSILVLLLQGGPYLGLTMSVWYTEVFITEVK